MTDIGPDVLACGLAAGLSGSAFLATVIVLATNRGTVNASARLVGFTAVLGAADIAAAALAGLVTGAGGQHPIMPMRGSTYFIRYPAA